MIKLGAYFSALKGHISEDPVSLSKFSDMVFGNYLGEDGNILYI